LERNDDGAVIGAQSSTGMPRTQKYDLHRYALQTRSLLYQDRDGTTTSTAIADE
jgi:hypothetical protein